MSSKYVPPKPSLPPDYEDFLKSLSEQEKVLMEIATEKLGSSFFVQWCHAYVSWKSKQGTR